MKKVTALLVLVGLLTLPITGLAGQKYTSPPVNSGLQEAGQQTSGAAWRSPGVGWIAYWLICAGLLGAGSPPPIGEWFDKWK